MRLIYLYHTSASHVSTRPTFSYFSTSYHDQAEDDDGIPARLLDAIIIIRKMMETLIMAKMLMTITNISDDAEPHQW